VSAGAQLLIGPSYSYTGRAFSARLPWSCSAAEDDAAEAVQSESKIDTPNNGCRERLVNMAMVMMASSAFHVGHSNVADIETAYHTLTPLLSIGTEGVFLVLLIAVDISSRRLRSACVGKADVTADR
jgi:Mn2+/Fe2+ NRAMP family transporter